MSSYNRVILMGNLTRDPEVKTIPSGSHVANLAMAVNRRYLAGNGEKREEVTYVDVTFWGKQAELFERLGIRKGTPIFIDGRLHLESWEDKSSGQKRSRLKVVGESFQLLGGRKEDGGRQDTVVRRGYDQTRGGGGGTSTESSGGSGGQDAQSGEGYGYSEEPF